MPTAHPGGSLPGAADLLNTQAGRTAIVTGASSGIGEMAARELAARGAHVVLAVRDAQRGNAARTRILEYHPNARVDVSIVDLASLSSIRHFAARSNEELPRLDVLLNNAGLGLVAERTVTEDGFELQFGTNHLGHFALTGLMMRSLLRAPAARVVTISSIAHQYGRVDFGDLQGLHSYDGQRAYTQSKLANLLFALELDRRARGQDLKLVSVAAHPGIARTSFFQAPGVGGLLPRLSQFFVGLLAHDAIAGAAPGLHAATMLDVSGGDYWGPSGFKELRGRPAPARVSMRARDHAVAQRLWRASEEMTGVAYNLDGA